MFLANAWKEYEVLDCGGGEKLERWGDIVLRRPDPQAIWPVRSPEIWNTIHAWYHRNEQGGGRWEFFRALPERWSINYGDLQYWVRPTGFKHMGLFPEQSTNWDWMRLKIREGLKQRKEIHVLNLFGYTGDLRGMTQGRAASSMELFAYEEVPPNVAQEIIEESAAK